MPWCAWSFDAHYERSVTATFPLTRLNSADTLNLGGHASKHQFVLHVLHLAYTSEYALWLGVRM
jgi:hypothetical protein